MITPTELKELKGKLEFLQSENVKFDSRYKLCYKIRRQALDIEAGIENAHKTLDFIRSHPKLHPTWNIEEFEADLKFCEEELLPLANRLTQYRSFQESTMHDYMRLIGNKYEKRENWYYITRDLVNMVNAYWDITDEKPSNRIAWGWSQCRSKSNPSAYLYGCIRNYLKRNGKFDKDEFNGIWSGRTI